MTKYSYRIVSLVAANAAETMCKFGAEGFRMKVLVPTHATLIMEREDPASEENKA